MKLKLKKVRQKLPFYQAIRDYRNSKRQSKDLAKWQSAGKPDPPPHLVKQRVLKEYAEKYNLRTLVETGTKYGDMIHAMKDVFDEIYSIELSQDLYEGAKRRFKKEKHIILIQGDSTVELGKVVERLKQPALFYLDGHHSGGVTEKGVQVTPILTELSHVFRVRKPGHVVIIDDARLFRSDPDYPEMEELRREIELLTDEVIVAEEYDSIRIVPSEQSS